MDAPELPVRLEDLREAGLNDLVVDLIEGNCVSLPPDFHPRHFEVHPRVGAVEQDRSPRYVDLVTQPVLKLFSPDGIIHLLVRSIPEINSGICLLHAPERFRLEYMKGLVKASFSQGAAQHSGHAIARPKRADETVVA